MNEEAPGTRPSDSARPGICLIVPHRGDGLPRRRDVEAVLSEHRIASIRLTSLDGSVGDPRSMADILLSGTDGHETSVLIDSRPDLVLPLGLHGVHLRDGAKSVRLARRKLPKDYTVGAFCGNSRDEAYRAGDDGADYVSFGPLETPGEDASRVATSELFDLWSCTTLLPALAESCNDRFAVAAYSEVSDFIVIGEDLWRSEEPSQELARLLA